MLSLLPNSVMAEVLYTLGVCFDNKDYLEKSKRMLSRMPNQLLEGETNYYTSWCFLAGLFSYGTNEVAILGRMRFQKIVNCKKPIYPHPFLWVQKEKQLFLFSRAKQTKQDINICVHQSNLQATG
jgi:uncharacterized protein YyaL (SSP411 family)